MRGETKGFTLILLELDASARVGQAVRGRLEGEREGEVEARTAHPAEIVDRTEGMQVRLGRAATPSCQTLFSALRPS